LGRQTQWLYALDPTNSGAVTITDARGYQTQEVLSDGEPTSITNAYGTSDATTTTYGYFSGTDGTSSVTTAAGTPYAETTTYTYNTPGDLLSKSAPAPSSTGTWTWSYNSLNEVTSSQTPLQAAAGVSAQLTYDSNGNLKSTSVPLPTNGTDTPSSTYATTTYNYGTGCSIAGANGCYTGDVQSIVSPLGNVSGANAANYTTNYTYDSYGDQTSVTDPLGNKATDVYNDIGELLCTVSAKETALGVSCPTAGSWVSGATAYTYDNYGDLLSETNPAGYESSATYDDIGDQLTYTDAMSPSNTTDFKFDNDGEPTQTTYPDGTTTSTTYDPDGDVLTTTDKGATSPLTPTRLWTRSPRCKQPSRPS
jgi:YD repeat-containing protein